MNTPFERGEVVQEIHLVTHGINATARFMDGGYRNASKEEIAARIEHMKQEHADVILEGLRRELLKRA